MFRGFVDKLRVYCGESRTPAAPWRPFRLTAWAEGERKPGTWMRHPNISRLLFMRSGYWESKRDLSEAL